MYLLHYSSSDLKYVDSLFVVRLWSSFFQPHSYLYNYLGSSCYGMFQRDSSQYTFIYLLRLLFELNLDTSMVEIEATTPLCKTGERGTLRETQTQRKGERG